VAAEAKVSGRERAIRIANVAKVAGDTLVEADIMPRGAAQVMAEVTKTGMELLEDDGLGLNFTNLLRNDTLGHLLEHNQALLDNFNSFSMANHLLLLDDLLDDVRAVEVIGTVEVVEVIKG
jgi:hypothetical protein